MHKPDVTRADLELVYAKLRIKNQSLDDMLKNPALKKTLENSARLQKKRDAIFDPLAVRSRNED
ncbi:hypothetical protein [Undibacterium aquatile]|uniref:Uncharacterized protein n=1 Tax=Undibacterium aquatile TaxID=1537398 RepID=A0ABR6XES9_9BURK|nr:hypothetical protein [Undibacterium aquatile]MBC3811361.1 hypothetical protein [Undibacterium aquatile]